MKKKWKFARGLAELLLISPYGGRDVPGKNPLLVTRFLLQEVAILLAGDEIARTQRGGNIAYCRDDVIGRGARPPVGGCWRLLPMMTEYFSVYREGNE